MSRSQPTRSSSLARAIKKTVVSSFVIFTFIAYALHERFANPGEASIAAPTPRPAATQQALAPTQALPGADPPTQAPLPPTPAPTEAPPAPTQAPAVAGTGSGYKDGQFAGAAVDAFYGMVQVQAVIQSGKLTDVQFLEYPNDRRTSIRINRVAMPYLTSEAIQAQSSEVDVISGATLTSEAFIESLRSALHTAKA
jgi:uncharacterized protein with FMN-binding domain